MPCYTEITIEIMDKEAAEKTLAQMGKKGKIIKRANDAYWDVKLEDGEAISATFKSQFLQEYGVQVATAKAEMDGYFVSREDNDNGEVELTLRQY